MRPRLLPALLFLVPLACLCQDQKVAGDSHRNPVEGARIFQYYCAACHGADGRGHGPAAAALKHAAPDLTLISRNNDGKFPYRRVREIVEGTAAPSVAGNRKMPVWGPVFHQIEADQDWGEVRLDAVTRHIESIQRK